MRNVHDPGAAEAPQPDDGTNAVYSSAVARRSRRRRQTMIGAVGLLSILGVGALVAGQVFDDRDTARSSQADALRADPHAASAPPVAAGPSTTPRAGAASAANPSAAPAAAPLPRTSAERIQAARSASAKAKATAQVLRPLPDAAVADVSEADVSTTTVRRAGETVRVMSARADLTGYRELGWTVDDGEQVGNARCTSKIRLSTDVKARERPTLLLCWRTSPTKSVYTVAVKPDGRPSAKLSATAIDRAWAELG